MGFVPGPDEDETLYVARVELCLEKKASNPFIAEVAKRTKELYDVEPTWVPLYFSNIGLAIWHGGGTLIGDDVSIQLRKPLKEKKKYLGFYNRDEFLVHELAHVGRFAFNEPHYDELLCYRTSTRPLHKWLGPLIQNPWEVWVFIVSLLIPIFTDYMLLAFDQTKLFRWGAWVYTLPLLVLAYGLIRLAWRQTAFRATIRHLKKLTKHPLPVVYRLTDHEIELFARHTSTWVSAYIATQTSLRWRTIKLAYLEDVPM